MLQFLYEESGLTEQIRCHTLCMILCLYARFKKRDVLWNSECVCPSVCLSVNFKVLCLALVYVLYLKKVPVPLSMTLESQMHLGYCMGIYASDVGSHLYFSQNLLFSEFSLFYQH